jgi:voltage-gated potassium channel
MVRTAPAATDDPRLAAWERNTRWLIILAALIPLLGALTGRSTLDARQLGIDSVAWLVFAVDFVVHLRWKRRFLRTWQGWVDLGVVVVTFPWYVIPALRGSEFTVVARLARVARILVIVVKGGVVKLALRLGKTALFAVALVVSTAVVVQRAEPPGSGFDSFGDALWWAIVTITTVGYGDLVPETVQGRIAATILMVGGLAVLGAIAAIMASFLRGEDVEEELGGDADDAEVDLRHIVDRLENLDRKFDSLLPTNHPDP